MESSHQVILVGDKRCHLLTLHKKYFTESNIDLSKAIMIGDTIHDMEVANELNIDSILIANGHQSYDRLIKLKNEVYKTIKEINI